MVTNLRDQLAVVTGGASGIGFAIAQRLKHDGATVVIFDVSGAGETAAELGMTGIAVDVTDPRQSTVGACEQRLDWILASLRHPAQRAGH
jgi:NAD(P)-dependent dehydrogenase (short-subunit alcohol dehydrogenase family)